MKTNNSNGFIPHYAEIYNLQTRNESKYVEVYQKPSKLVNSAGFTLMEMVLTLAIVVAILGVIYAVFVTTIAGQQEIENLMDSTSIGPSIMMQIIQDLESLTIPTGDKNYFLGQDTQDSIHDTDRIDFVSSALALSTEENKPQFATLNEVSYLLKRNDKESSLSHLFILYKRHQPHIDEEPQKGGILHEIYNRCRGLDLKFYDGKDWLDGWNHREKGKLPEAMKIKLTLLDKESNEQTFTTYHSFLK